MSSRTFQLWIFTLRLWQEPVDDEVFEWRGEVKNTASGETRYFRDLHRLAELLPVMLVEGDAPTGDGPYSMST
jgi:hypothetical protein